MGKKHKSNKRATRAGGRRSGKPRTGKRTSTRASKLSGKRTGKRASGPTAASALADDPADAPSDDPVHASETPIAELADRAWKYADSDELRAALKDLSPEEAAMFVLLIEKQLKRRRLQLIGYGMSFLVFLIGMFVAFLLYANREPGEFVGWAFLIPFVLVAASFVIFGRLAKKA